MKDIYPMFKLCRLFREKENEWQKEDLSSRIILNSLPGNWTDESVVMEREARITTGEAKSVSEYRLIDEYIKRYYPEHLKLSKPFGALVRIDRSKPNADYLKQDIKTIIDNCIDKKYGYLSKDTENPERVYLNAEGREFVSPPFLWKTPINVGIIKAYSKALGIVKGMIVWVVLFLATNVIPPIISWIKALLYNVQR